MCNCPVCNSYNPLYRQFPYNPAYDQMMYSEFYRVPPMPFPQPPMGAPGGYPSQFPSGPPSQLPGGPPSQLPGGPPSQSPGGPPPSFKPSKSHGHPKGGGPSLKAVDPGAIRPCKYRYVYIWLDNGSEFWAWLTDVGRRSVSGYRWTGRRWVYFGVDLNKIDSFQCF